MNPRYLFAFVTVLAVLPSCSKKNDVVRVMPDSNNIPVKVMALSKKDVQQPIHVTGKFSNDDQAFLSFKTGGIIQRIFVKEGEAIKRGQLLAVLHLTEINAQVKQAELAFGKATRDFQRVTNLYRDSVATLEQFENSKTALDVATQQLQAAKFNLSFSEIRAVNDGFVLKKMANSGEMIESGKPVLFTNGNQGSKWLLRAAVSDKEWAVISIHDAAAVSIDAFEGEQFKAEVLRKSESADPATGSFTVELALKGKVPQNLANGLFGRATIVPLQKRSVWSIPYESLLDGDAQNGYVFVTNDTKTASKVSVTVSGIESNRVLVSKGLEQAKYLIVSGGAYLRDKSGISVVN